MPAGGADEASGGAEEEQLAARNAAARKRASVEWHQALDRNHVTDEMQRQTAMLKKRQESAQQLAARRVETQQLQHLEALEEQQREQEQQAKLRAALEA